MTDFNNIELKNIDPEDISDVLLKIEKSFGIKFGKTELNDVNIFGELCDIIINKVHGENLDDCTTQQGFYKLRNAIAETPLSNKGSITPDTKLQILFPRKSRRKKILQTEKLLGFKTKVLRPRHWISGTLVLILVVSLVGLFFIWKVFLATFICSIIGLTIATKFGIEFDLQTVGQFAEKISRENYLKSRRHETTANKNEVEQKVRELFSNDLYLDEHVLKREATFD